MSYRSVRVFSNIEDLNVTDDITVADDATVSGDLAVTGNATVGGTLGVTGVATLTAAPVVSALTASQAVFTNGGKALVSNPITGSGSVVMSASPTLTGTAVFNDANFANVNVSGALSVDLDEVDAPKSFCSIYKSTLDVISTTLGSTPAQITGTFSTEHKSADFTVTASGGRMTYTGAVTRKFYVRGHLTCGSSNLRTVQTKFSKDGGSTFTNTVDSCTLQAATEFSFPISGYVQLAQNEYVELFALVTSSTSNVYTTHSSISIMEYPVAR